VKSPWDSVDETNAHRIAKKYSKTQLLELALVKSERKNAKVLEP